MRRQKIINKSKSWWKHGKHGARLEVALLATRLAAGRPKVRFEELDLREPDWSSRRRRRR